MPEGRQSRVPAEIDSIGPAFEFNWGAIPRVQQHIIAPFGSINPSNNPIYAPGGTGPLAFGFTDMETGVKIAFMKASKYIPQIGTFTMFELPTGNYDKSLSVGKVWYKVPLCLQKNIGHCLLDAGGGRAIVPQTGYSDFTFGAFLLKYRESSFCFAKATQSPGRPKITPTSVCTGLGERTRKKRTGMTPGFQGL